MEFIISFLVISIVGTLLHFVYEWSNHNKIVSLFAAVNESTWEHIKIALTPMFLWGLYDGYVYGFSPNYFLAKSISLLAVIIIIPLLFYGYKLITKKSILIIDIMIFYIAIASSIGVFYYLIKNLNCTFIYSYIGAILLFIIFSLYLLLTIMPLKNELFLDPITKKFILDSNGDRVKELVKQDYLTYRVVPVFDIKQTEGKDLPRLVDELKGSINNYKILKESIEEVAKVPIEYIDIKDESKGYYSLDENNIKIKKGMDEKQTLKTLIHELTHSRLHNTIEALSDRAAAEVQAESVAFIVSDHFEIDTSEYSFGYVAAWSMGKDISELKKSLNIISKESNKIIIELENAIEKNISKYRKIDLLKDRSININKKSSIKTKIEHER